MQEDGYIRDLNAISDRLNALNAVGNAQVDYDIFADALVWSDEYPNDLSGMVREFQSLRIILRCRTAMVFGVREDPLLAYWGAAKELFPGWPGFMEERCAESAELQEVFHKLKRDQNKLLGCE